MKASAKTQKRTKKQNNYKNPWFIVTAVVCVVVLAYIALNISAILIHQHQDNLDKQKFAQIETLVNSVKAELDQKVPHGEWQLSKYCTEGHVTFGPGPIACYYGVESNVTSNLTELKSVLASSPLTYNGTGVYKDGTSVGYDPHIKDVGCHLYTSTVDIMHVVFTCISGARTHIYTFDPTK